MHRTSLLALLLIPLSATLRAQTPHCGAQQASAQILAEAEAHIAEQIEASSSARTAAQMLYIPVVVHVVYNTPAQNISDAVVKDYLAELNSAFRKTRTPPFTPRPIFDSLRADMEIAFCLATQDPSGAPTTGITHTQTTTFFSGFVGPVKNAASGGVDPWPVTSYLNIWIAPVNNLFGNAVNNNVYANGTETEGIVVSSAFPLVLGNVLAHEAGHFVGLHHTFDNAAELVDDTPWEGTGGHAYLNRIGNTCAPGDLDSNTSTAEAPYWGTKNPPDMIENFMGYNRPCQFMFTKGQVARARASVQQFYAGLIKPACAALSVAAADAQRGELIAYVDRGATYLVLRGGQARADFAVVRMDGAVVRRGVLLPNVPVALDELATGIYGVRCGERTKLVSVQ